MQKVLPVTLLFSLVLATGTMAQSLQDGEAAILPVGAQSCELPDVPGAIADDADYDALVAQQGKVKQFQQNLQFYRKCLGKYDGSPDLTEGNKIAISAAHNYSVDLEEQVAEDFNLAVRAYKSRQKNN